MGQYGSWSARFISDASVSQILGSIGVTYVFDDGFCGRLSAAAIVCFLRVWNPRMRNVLGGPTGDGPALLGIH